jgi:hypothetical protein
MRIALIMTTLGSLVPSGRWTTEAGRPAGLKGEGSVNPAGLLSDVTVSKVAACLDFECHV